MSKKVNKGQKLTAEQREAKVEAARAKEIEQARQKERKEKIKKAGIIAVCIILVVALGLPTVALSVIGSGAA